MANRKAQTPQAAVAVATKEATDSDSSAAVAARENTAQTTGTDPESMENAPESAAQTPEQAQATPPEGQEGQNDEGREPTATGDKDAQAEVRQEPHMPAGTRAAAQRSEAFAAPNASDSECRAGRATEEYPLLEDVAVLAIRHRVAAWEQAALLRMMGWADGKMIADADYRAALAKLHGRRLGGGRLA